ncbi:hypothetical protein J6253_03160 [bacterium]|nr:hypothetical protein [bacterium]MBP5592230.1 hypothetical protein [bacterium]
MNMWDFILKLRNKECPDDMNEMLNFWTEALCKDKNIRGWFRNAVQLKEDYVRAAVIDIMISAGKKEDENEKNKDRFRSFIEQHIDTEDEAAREEKIKSDFYKAVYNKVWGMVFVRKKGDPSEESEESEKQCEYKEPALNAVSIDYTPDENEKNMEQKHKELQEMGLEDKFSCDQIMELVDTEIFDKVVDFIEKKDAWGHYSEFKDKKFPIYFHNPKFVDIKTYDDIDKLIWTKNVTNNLCLDDEGKCAKDFILFMPWEKYPLKNKEKHTFEECPVKKYTSKKRPVKKYTSEEYIGYIKSKYKESHIEEKFEELNLNDSTISGNLRGENGVEKEFHRLLDEKKLTSKDIHAYCYKEFEDIIREKFEKRMPDIIDLENSEEDSEISD